MIVQLETLFIDSILDPVCHNARLDPGTDVDMDDFGIFQGCMSGPNVPADPSCAE